MSRSIGNPLYPTVLSYSGIPNDTRELTVHFNGNPWKVVDPELDLNVQKIYRHCVVCGYDKYSDQEWNTLDRSTFTQITASYQECLLDTLSLWDCFKGKLPTWLTYVSTDEKQNIRRGGLQREYTNAIQLPQMATLIEHSQFPQGPLFYRIPTLPQTSNEIDPSSYEELRRNGEIVFF